MTTAAVTREPPPGAANTEKLQRMLDMEHKVKMERLHPLIPTSELPKRRPVTMQPPARPPQPLQARRKAHSRGGSLVMNAAMIKMTDDNDLHVRVPTPPWRASKSNRLEPMPLSRASLHPPKTVSFSGRSTPTKPATEEDKKSETSSICHSPSWEGYGQRKKDKKAEEKQKRKDKEQAEKDARDAKRKSSRLVKKPPSASRSNMILSGRSTSTPELLDSTTTSSRRSSIHSDASQLPPPPKHGRQRSSSVASQIRAAFTGYLGPKEEKEPEVGFVGGLKLEMERESAARPGAQSASPDDLRSTLPPPGPRKANSYGPESMVASESGHPALPRMMTDSFVPVTNPMRPKNPPPLSMRTSSRSESLISPTAPPMPGKSNLDRWKLQNANKSAADVADHAGHASESEAEDSSRGRNSGSYVYQQRQISQDRAITGFKDDAKVLTKSRYPPQAHRRYQGVNFNSNESSSPTNSSFGFRKTSSSDSRSSSTDRGRFLDSLGSFGKPYDAPSLDLTSLDGDAERTPKARSRSNDTNASTPRGFKGAMQAAFRKVRSSSKPPSASSSFFERQSRDSMTTPDSFAMSRPPSSDAEKTTPAMSFTLDDFKPPVIKDPNSVRSNSSASSSLYEESMRSPVYTNTPDSSRPQSDKGLPPVVGEVGKGKTENLLVTNDERVFRLSHRAMVAESTPAGPSPLTPKSALNAFQLDLPPSDNKPSLNRDNSQGHIHPLLRKPKSRPAAIQTDQHTLTPLDVDGSKSSLIPLPLEVTPVPSPGDRSPAAPGSTVADETEESAGASLARVPSLSKSKSSPNVLADVRSESPIAPPQRSPKRDKHAFQSTQSLPDALDASVTSGAESPRSPDPATYLEEARKAAPSAAIPRSLRASGVSAGRKDGEFEPIAKMFVECCHCKFFHDMPSRVYECMAHPDATVEDSRLGVSGAISTVVNCPWCRHGMTTECCAGYAAVVHLKERLH
ncbi:hypothetical protein F5X68DRAFT_231354 [Plectosphaerella plurivora]|uniref:Uncharacterized protein n=1 Tax=Plectosphaerella plurivora TaxID=936078 RepID=A0A9P9ABC6_9PEZI|nr:hypothetical protein F5X68DRAFT_231354 [Plectosphaerella plurivora]